MAKAGLEMLTKSTALELAPLGIRVNAVAPCFVQTANESNLYRYSGLSESEIEALKGRAANNIPLVRKYPDSKVSADERVVRDLEVSKAVIFLTSEMAQKVTGHIMKVDGGKTLTSKGQQDWYGSKAMNRNYE
jgi:NAD(P)-dependent dehydrogenase (short-subunit alcohol dehydrogenase family)